MTGPETASLSKTLALACTKIGLMAAGTSRGVCAESLLRLNQEAVTAQSVHLSVRAVRSMGRLVGGVIKFKSRKRTGNHVLGCCFF